jgi:hypothetical protein
MLLPCGSLLNTLKLVRNFFLNQILLANFKKFITSYSNFNLLPKVKKKKKKKNSIAKSAKKKFTLNNFNHLT